MTASLLIVEAVDATALYSSLDPAPAVSRGPVLVRLSVGAGASRYHCTVACRNRRWPVSPDPFCSPFHLVAPSRAARRVSSLACVGAGVPVLLGSPL